MNELSYLWNRRRLLRTRRKVRAVFRKERKRAEKQKKSRDEIESIISSEMFEIDMVDDDIETLEHRYLTDRARELFIPVPKFGVGVAWMESRITGRHRLSNQALWRLRSAIRTERKERREGVVEWISALTGLIKP
jgi:hypothetical protein